MSTETSLCISGVGLIGGSIAAAVRKHLPDCHIIGHGRSEDRLRATVNAGLIDEYRTDLSRGCLPKECLGIVCLPVDHIVSAVEALLFAGCELVTDAGSVKGPICRALENEHRFVGSHPIAGSDQTGFESAVPDLFAGKVCVVTGPGPNDDRAVRVASFWQKIGMVVTHLGADEHDRILALTSHLPHVLAATGAGCVTTDMLPFVGTGFRDTTRIAAGSAAVWAPILLSNATHCIAAIDCAEQRLAAFRQAIASGDAEAVARLWNESAAIRQSLNSR